MLSLQPRETKEPLVLAFQPRNAKGLLSFFVDVDCFLILTDVYIFQQ